MASARDASPHVQAPCLAVAASACAAESGSACPAPAAAGHQEAEASCPATDPDSIVWTSDDGSTKDEDDTPYQRLYDWVATTSGFVRPLPLLPIMSVSSICSVFAPVKLPIL